MIATLVSLVFQALVFYLVPPLTLGISPFSTVFTILILTAVISTVLGTFSRSGFKLLFPFLAALVFIPSVFIFYNESAIIHSVWYLAVSLLGIALGALFGLFSGNR